MVKSKMGIYEKQLFHNQVYGLGNMTFYGKGSIISKFEESKAQPDQYRG